MREHFAKLAELKGLTPKQRAKRRTEIDQFATEMDRLLYIERSKPITDDRAVKRRESLSRFARALVFSR